MRRFYKYFYTHQESHNGWDSSNLLSHVHWGNFIRETSTSFELSGSPKSPTLVYVSTNSIFASAGDKIRPPITEVIICTTVSDLDKLKKLRDWVMLNSILLLPLLTKISYSWDTSICGVATQDLRNQRLKAWVRGLCQHTRQWERRQVRRWRQDNGQQEEVYRGFFAQGARR